MSSGYAARFFVFAVVACVISGPAAAEELSTLADPGPWEVETFKTGLVAVSRSGDHRTALLIFCTLYGTRSIVYAFDGRGMRSEDIPISQVRVQATPMMDVMGLFVPSRSATFDNDGYVIRMQIPLPAEFEPAAAERMMIMSGPGALPANRWSVAVNNAGLDDSVRIAFKNCV